MQRRLQPERMDQPGLDASEHARALAGLRRINRVSGVVGAVWRELATLTASGRPLRVLDIASGAGDLAIGLSRRARRRGRPIEVVGVDVSPTAVATANARARDDDSVTFDRLDAVDDDLPPGFDAVVCTLFLHHLTRDAATRLLAGMGRAAGGAVIVSDLRRTLAGLALAHVACRVLSRSPIVRYDGPVSVEGAFTLPELRGIAADAGLQGARVRRAWPQRMMLTWRPPSATGTDA